MLTESAKRTEFGLATSTWAKTTLGSVITMLKIIAMVILVGAGLALGDGSWGHFSPVWPSPGGSPWVLLAVALIPVMYTYSGWNATVYVGSEVKNPGRTIPYSLLLGTLLITVLYLVMNMVYLYAIPVWKMKGVVAVAAEASSALFGRQTSQAISGLIAFLVFKTENGQVSPWALALVFSVGVGFRQDLLLFMGPVVVFSLWRTGSAFKQRALMLAAFTIITLGWYLLTVAMSGGSSPFALARKAVGPFASSASFLLGATFAENARKKVEAKKLDLVVANDISKKNIGFESDMNLVTLLYRDGRVEHLSLMTKISLAKFLVSSIVRERKKIHNECSSFNHS